MCIRDRCVCVCVCVYVCCVVFNFPAFLFYFNLVFVHCIYFVTARTYSMAQSPFSMQLKIYSLFNRFYVKKNCIRHSGGNPHPITPLGIVCVRGKMKGNGQTAEEHQNEFRDKCDRGCLATGGLHTNPLYSDRNHVLNALFPVY